VTVEPWYVAPFEYVLPFRGEQLTLNRVWHALKAEGVDYGTRCALVHKVMSRIVEDHRAKGHLEGDGFLRHVITRASPDYQEFEDIIFSMGCDHLGIAVDLGGHDSIGFIYRGTTPRMVDFPATLDAVGQRKQELIDEGKWNEAPEVAISPDEFGERGKEAREEDPSDTKDVALYASQQGLWT
jgi:hypothetical protein